MRLLPAHICIVDLRISEEALLRLSRFDDDLDKARVLLEADADRMAGEGLQLNSHM